MCFTTDLHANAHLSAFFAENLKMINADRLSASLAGEPGFVPFWWWTAFTALSGLQQFIAL